jgi:hypothetical protein
MVEARAGDHPSLQMFDTVAEAVGAPVTVTR